MDINKLINTVPNSVIAELPSVITKFNIDTIFRLSNFLGQIDHESGHFKRVEENLMYITIEQFTKIFKHDVDKNHDKVLSPEEITYAKTLLGHPEKIANFVYANQNGNGNETSGDGWKHRGFGYMQTTGKKNQEAFFIFMGLPTNSDPELIATKYPLASAAYFWISNKLNVIADKGVNNAVIGEITHVVNGGLIDLDKRIICVDKYYNILK